MCAAAALVRAESQYILVTPHNYDFLDNETSWKIFGKMKKMDKEMKFLTYAVNIEKDTKIGIPK